VIEEADVGFWHLAEKRTLLIRSTSYGLRTAEIIRRLDATPGGPAHRAGSHHERISSQPRWCRPRILPHHDGAGDFVLYQQRTNASGAQRTAST
jgi:hypothetical protein